MIQKESIVLPPPGKTQHLSVIQIAIEPPNECDDATILDVLRSADFVAGISFKFYVRLAATFPRLQRLLAENRHLLPREGMGKSVLMPRAVQLSRAWAFDDEAGETFGSETFTENQPSHDVIQQYEFTALHIRLGKANSHRGGTGFVRACFHAVDH